MQLIRELRESSGISVKQLSEKSGIEPGSIYHYETNRRMPNFSQCWEILNALNELGCSCSFEEVFPNPTKVKNLAG
ncbi:helix-turn-helix domain-containing protein [Vibrio sp. AK197]